MRTSDEKCRQGHEAGSCGKIVFSQEQDFAERDPRSLHCPISPLTQTQLGLDETLVLGLMG